VLGPNTNF